MRTKAASLLLLLLLLLPAARSAAADAPSGARLVRGPNGELFGGYQIDSADERQFELFAIQSWHSQPGGLGRFSGVLADLAVDPTGRLLVLTRDGALNVHGEETEALALPDDRWNMAALAWTEDGPEAVSVDGGVLWTARPDGERNWQRSERPIADAGGRAGAQLLVKGKDLHLFWAARAADLSAGAIRHAVRRDGKWEERDAIPVGDAAAFSVRTRGEELVLLAIVPDILGEKAPRVVARAWDGTAWRREAPPERLARTITGAADFAVTEEHILTTGQAGAQLSPTDSDGEAFRLLDTEPSAPGYSAWASVLLMTGFVALLLVYSRRSRSLSRQFPGRTPDLISRAVALATDWSLVSIAMSAYHIANGDVAIFQELLTIGAVDDIFWINLGALALFVGLSEGLYGTSPGKWLAGMRVRSVFGGRPGFLQGLFRNALRCADMFPVGIGFPGLVGLVAALLNPRRQRIGDIMASTIVRRHAPLSSRRFVLASASPRRQELLSAMGLNPEVRPANVNETLLPDEEPRDAVIRLSAAKAKVWAREAEEGQAIVIAADTVVVLDGVVLGKPADAGEAAAMLARLSGRSHTVFTGVTVRDGATGQTLSDAEETEVEFRDLSRAEIESYVATGEPLDKAGGYGVQSGLLVKQIRGSLSNVAGLPMEMLQEMLDGLDG